MLKTKSQTEYYKGSSPNTSLTNQKPGVFSLCSGGVPYHGAFARIPGKTLQAVGDTTGGVFSIYQFGNKIVVQRFVGIEIYDLGVLAPLPADYVYDNEGNLVYDNGGIPVTQ